MIPELRSYQIDVTNRVRARMAAGAKRVILQASTGAGKTSCAAHVAKLAVDKGKRVLFLAHRRKLVEQISERLFDFQVDHGVFMRGHPRERGAKVQVASRDTFVSRVIDNGFADYPPADLVIADETRHILSPEYQGIMKLYPNAYVLGLDATPVRSDGTGLGPWYQAIECAAPTSQLIRDGFLVNTKCYAPERMGKRRKAGKIVRGIAGDLVESYKKYGKEMRAVVFAGRITHSKEAVDMFNAEGIPAAHVDADTPDEERDEIIANLESDRLRIVCNVGIWGEGVDVPCLGCCIFWCNVSSRVRFLQGVGRIMRPFPGKDHAVLIDHAAAVFQHGFPDEDTDWPLLGDANLIFANKTDRKTVHYCHRCELTYKDTLECPQCGGLPQKAPKSIFAAPDPEIHDELLVECERNGTPERAVEEKKKHWLRCIAVAFNRGSTFGMALAIFKKKYVSDFPDQRWPMVPGRGQWKTRVADLYPNFGRKR